MSIRPFVLGLALAAPFLAQAAHTVTNSVFSCTAAMSFSNTASLVGYCAGNFTVSGGTWNSDTRIDLSATGDITLDGVTMTAPIIDLQSLTTVTLTSTTVLTAASTLNIHAPGRPPAPRDPAPGRGEPLNPPSNVSGGSGGTLAVTEGGALEVAAGGGSSNADSFFSGGNGGDIPTVGGDLLVIVRDDAPLIQYAGGASSQGVGAYTINVSTIPEPDAYALALAALATSAALARRRKA